MHGAAGFILVGVSVLALITHAYAGVIGASWVPTRKRDLTRVIAASRGFRGKTIIDLGCGDGTVMRAFAAQYPSSRVIGYELSAPLWIVARFRNFFSPFRTNCRVIFGNAYKVSLSEADLIYCFLLPHAMEKLKNKLLRELKPGTIMITYSFPVAGWRGEEAREQGKLPIYRYVIQ